MTKKTVIAILSYLMTLSCSFLLPSCSVFSPVKSEVTTTYVINTVPVVRRERATAINVLVTPTQANNIYNTTSMAYTTRPYEISYFSKNRWIEPPSQMLYPLIIKALENTHHFHYVSSANTSFRPSDYTLNTYLLKLYEDFSHLPYSVHMVLKAEIINTGDNRVIAVKEFSVSTPLQQNTPYYGVIATNNATAILLQQLVQFCLNKIR